MTTPSANLPTHGWINCRKCFQSGAHEQRHGSWKIVNDPGAWGATNPRVLVLGFSKGFTQASAGRNDRFENVPFKGMRPRLSETLSLLGILKPSEDVSGRMISSESELAFGSLVRCSLSRFNARTERFECTGAIMPKAFVEDVSAVVRTCAETYLSLLPESLRLVIVLGTGDAYIDGCRDIVRSLYSSTFGHLNDVAYRTADTWWVHVSHPSGLNGHHTAWMAGDAATKQGRKQLLAKSTIVQALATLRDN